LAEELWADHPLAVASGVVVLVLAAAGRPSSSKAYTFRQHLRRIGGAIEE
jgi:hypothetical protein